MRATERTPSSCLTLLLFSRSTFCGVVQIKSGSERRRRTAASTWACKARLVSLSIVLAISPKTCQELITESSRERLTLELPVDNGKVLQNNTVFEGSSM